MRGNEALFNGSKPRISDGVKNDWSGLPVVFDEVFTGLYRLGRFSAASFLGVDPDISVHAKLLTGGLVPLAATLASESIFESFKAADKSHALLHGHSYTAHPVGCQVAIESIQTMQKMEDEGNWEWANGPENGWHSEENLNGMDGRVKSPVVWSVWNAEFVKWLSEQRRLPNARVKGVWAIGSVLSIHLDSEDASGYESNAAAAIQAALKTCAEDRGWNVHSRALGNVLYLMASVTTGKEDVERLEFLMRRFFDGHQAMEIA